MLLAATVAAALSWAPLPAATLARTEVALGNRAFAVEGGPQQGLAYSDASEFIDVPRRC